MKSLPVAVSESSLYLQIINVNSTLFGKLEILDHCFKLKTMLNTTAVLFTKVVALLVKTIWRILEKSCFKMG